MLCKHAEEMAQQVKALQLDMKKVEADASRCKASVANGTEGQALAPQVAIRERLKPPALLCSC